MDEQISRRTVLQSLGASAAGFYLPHENDGERGHPVDLSAAYDRNNLGGPEAGWTDNDLLNDVTTTATIDENEGVTLHIDLRDTGIEFYQRCTDRWMAGVYEDTPHGETVVDEFARPRTPVDERSIFEHRFFDELYNTCEMVHDIVVDNEYDVPHPEEAYGIDLSAEERSAIRRNRDSVSYRLTVHGEDGGHITYRVPNGVVPSPDPYSEHEIAGTDETLEDWSEILSYPREIVCGERER